MGEFYIELMADNGGYFLSAYAIVFGTLIGYALWLRSRLSAARSALEPDAPRDS